MTEKKGNHNKKQYNEADFNEAAGINDTIANDSAGEEETEEKSASDEVDVKTKKTKKDKKDNRISELEEKLDELSDRHLRLQAEFDNYKKRTLREKADIIKAGGEQVLSSILPVIDDFERAVNALKDIPDDDPAKQGTLLIYNKFREFLKQNNVSEIEALNLQFDVEYHEAMTKIPAPEENLKGKIIDVIQKGYLLNGKVIRYAKVVVGE